MYLFSAQLKSFRKFHAVCLISQIQLETILLSTSIFGLFDSELNVLVFSATNYAKY